MPPIGNKFLLKNHPATPSRAAAKKRIVFVLSGYGKVRRGAERFVAGLASRLGDRYDISFVTRKVFFYGVISSIPIFIFHPWQFPISRMVEWSVLLNILFLGVVASLICFSMWSISINKLGAVTCSNYVYLIPVTTVICSAIFLDEPMTAMAYTGSALILVGVYLANQGCKDDD